MPAQRHAFCRRGAFLVLWTGTRQPSPWVEMRHFVFAPGTYPVAHTWPFLLEQTIKESRRDAITAALSAHAVAR